MIEKFAEFEAKRDPSPIYEAVELIEADERQISIDDVAARKLAISRRLGFFAALDRNIDPTWDAAKPPVQGVPAPMPHGTVYGSGEVDPATIPDPQARAQYVQALKANKEDHREYFIQSQLRSIGDRAMLFTKQLLMDAHITRHELDDLLARSSVNESRKRRLRELLSSQ